MEGNKNGGWSATTLLDFHALTTCVNHVYIKNVQHWDVKFPFSVNSVYVYGLYMRLWHMCVQQRWEP